MSEQYKCKRCHSYAINPHQHGRTPGVNEHLCDVCYWRDQYEGADLRHGVAVARIASLEAQLAEARLHKCGCGIPRDPDELCEVRCALLCYHPDGATDETMAKHASDLLDDVLAEAREDSARLDWLCHWSCDWIPESLSKTQPHPVLFHHEDVDHDAASIRAAIDAAMSALMAEEGE